MLLTLFFWSFRFGKAHNHNNNLGDGASGGEKEASAYIRVYIEESYNNEYVGALHVNRPVCKKETKNVCFFFLRKEFQKKRSCSDGFSSFGSV